MSSAKGRLFSLGLNELNDMSQQDSPASLKKLGSLEICE